jgi:hypothetical protein
MVLLRIQYIMQSIYKHSRTSGSPSDKIVGFFIHLQCGGLEVRGNHGEMTHIILVNAYMRVPFLQQAVGPVVAEQGNQLMIML